MVTNDLTRIAPLDVDNYDIWSMRAEGYFSEQGLWDAVRPKNDDGSTPAAANAADDRKAKAILIKCVADHHVRSIYNAPSARAAWLALAATYAAASTARVLTLKNSLSELKLQPGEAITVYVSRAQDLQSQLAAAGSPVTEQDVSLSVLRGLPDEYAMIVTVITASDGALKLCSALPKLLAVEQLVAKESGGEPKAYFSRAASSSSSRPPRGGGGGGVKLCFYCEKPGHIAAECRQKERDMAARARAGHGGGSHGGGGSRGRWRGRRGGGGSKQQQQDEPRAFVASSVASAAHGSDFWVLDSGASHHIACDTSSMEELREPGATTFITFGNGTKAKVAGVGSVLMRTSEARPSFRLVDVMYVPEATSNLLSLSRAMAGGVRLTCRDGECVMRLDSDILARSIQLADGLMAIRNVAPKPVAPKPVALFAAATESAELWHQRMGHLGYRGLAQLAEQGMVTGIGVSAEAFLAAGEAVCEPCAAGKQHRGAFSTSASSSSKPLDLLHMDVCGPMPVASLGGRRYFATILDDYSKYSVVHPLDHKSAVPDIVMSSIQELQRQSGERVRVVRTDNGSEYVNKPLSRFFTAQGIVHQTSVRYTPQQNGVAERLNRTLSESMRSMLTGAKLSPSLWAEALVTANHIRVRSPVVGKSATPWELFHGTKPDVSQLRTFGCRAHVHVPAQLRKKMDPRSQPGIMVGYAPHSKAWRILLDNGRLTHSRDVLFDETQLGRSVSGDSAVLVGSTKPPATAGGSPGAASEQQGNSGAGAGGTAAGEADGDGAGGAAPTARPTATARTTARQPAALTTATPASSSRRSRWRSRCSCADPGANGAHPPSFARAPTWRGSSWRCPARSRRRWRRMTASAGSRR